MKRSGWHYKIEACIELSPEELKSLMENSDMHYDGKCKAASKVGGFLYGFKNQIEFGTPELCVSSHELGTMCKILEMANMTGDKVSATLYWELHQLLRDLNTEYRRLNPPEESATKEQ